MQSKKQQLEMDMEKLTFQIGKGLHLGSILSPCLFNLYTEYILWKGWLDELQAGIKIIGRNTNNLRYADDTSLVAEREEELKSLMMKVKRETEKALKLSIPKTKIMASDLIISWQREVKSGNSDRFYFPGLQNHCGQWLQAQNQKMLAPWKKSYDKPKQCVKN